MVISKTLSLPVHEHSIPLHLFKSFIFSLMFYSLYISNFIRNSQTFFPKVAVAFCFPTTIFECLTTKQFDK